MTAGGAEGRQLFMKGRWSEREESRRADKLPRTFTSKQLFGLSVSSGGGARGGGKGRAEKVPLERKRSEEHTVELEYR